MTVILLQALQCQAGMRWPHQSWREMHQSWMFVIHSVVDLAVVLREEVDVAFGDGGDGGGCDGLAWWLAGAKARF